MPFDEINPDAMAGPEVATIAAQPAEFASLKQTRSLGAGIIVFALLLGYLFIVFWNTKIPATTSATPADVCVAGSFMCFTASLDAMLLIFVMLAGALGSFIHAATSFGDFVGNKRLTTNWLWWYTLKPLIGAALAAIFYLCVRGGFLSGATQAESVNLYGIVALSGMVGMFSKQATDKLNEVFNTMFKTTSAGGDLKRKESLDNPVPLLSGSDPVRLAQGSRNLVITLTGKRFVDGAAVHVNGSARVTRFKDSTQLSATLLDADLAREGQLTVTVVNPGPGGGSSEPLALAVVLAAAVPALAVLGEGEDDIDGCSVDVASFTADEDLPVARGGVAS